MNKTEENMEKFYIKLLVIAVSFYFLEGILVNPFIFWTALPLYIVLSNYKSANKDQSKSKLYAGTGFLIVSVGFSYLYHLAWFFDWGETKTGSSTSGLIFIWFPIYAVVLGYIGYFVGYLVGKAKEHS